MYNNNILLLIFCIIICFIKNFLKILNASILIFEIQIISNLLYQPIKRCKNIFNSFNRKFSLNK